MSTDAGLERLIATIRRALDFYGATGHETYQRFDDKVVYIEDDGRRAREAANALSTLRARCEALEALSLKHYEEGQTAWDEADKLETRAEQAEAARDAAEKSLANVRAVLARHNDWHLNQGEVYLPDGKGGFVEVDGGGEYADTTLSADTERALHLSTENLPDALWVALAALADAEAERDALQAAAQPFMDAFGAQDWHRRRHDLNALSEMLTLPAPITPDHIEALKAALSSLPALAVARNAVVANKEI